MQTNAYILDWTMNDFAGLKTSLSHDGFEFLKDDDKEHIRVGVEFERLDDFAALIQRHLNAAFNYVDVQFSREKVTAVIFRDRLLRITNIEEDQKAKAWAVSIGLPKEQADWLTSF
jgi:hypothetical protein